MKLVIAAEIFPPDIGGPATYSKKLAEELAKRDWQVKLICYSNEPGNHEVVRVLRGQSTLKRYLKYFWRLLKISKDADVIYAQGPVSSGLPAVLVGKVLRKKVVVKVVGDYAWEQARNSNQTTLGIDQFQQQDLSGKAGSLKKIEKWVCQKAYKVIVPSNYLKNIVVGWGVNQDKVFIVYNAIAFPAEAAEIIDQSKDIILSIGRAVPWKGFAALIELMPDLLQINPNFKLVILGDGPDNEKLEAQVAALKMQDYVEIKKVGSELRDQYLKSAKVFILNTGYEGLSHTILEAMACGAPVITTDIGGNPELITDGENGLLVRPDDKTQIKEAILKLYNNKELQSRFIENSKKVLGKFTFENMINSTINILKITNQ